MVIRMHRSYVHVENDVDFRRLLSEFLFSAEGSPYKNNFKFEEELICDQPAPDILVKDSNSLIIFNEAFLGFKVFLPISLLLWHHSKSAGQIRIRGRNKTFQS